MQVQLFKKTGKYIDNKSGEERSYTNFYLKCGDSLIPVEPCYFPDPKNDNRDRNFASRKDVLRAFADTLPDKPGKAEA